MQLLADVSSCPKIQDFPKCDFEKKTHHPYYDCERVQSVHWSINLFSSWGIIEQPLVTCPLHKYMESILWCRQRTTYAFYFRVTGQSVEACALHTCHDSKSRTGYQLSWVSWVKVLCVVSTWTFIPFGHVSLIKCVV